MQSKLKVHLKLAISRLRIVQQKDTAIAKQQRRDMAQLLEQGKLESARIRVENIIRSDLTTELLEILELYCELLLARVGLMESQLCDPGLEEAVQSIIYAAPRTEIKELQQCRQLLAEKYGKEFTLDAMENKHGKVPERVLKKLRVQPPGAELVENYLKAIANTYDVPYGEAETSASVDADDKSDDYSSDGGQAERNLETPLSTQELSRMTPPRRFGPKSPVSIAPPSPSTENQEPQIKLSGLPALQKMEKHIEIPRKEPNRNGMLTESKIDGDAPDVNDLERRFAMLKR